MAGTVIPLLNVISLCESTTGWTAVGGTISLSDPTVVDARQGTYCLQNYSASTANRGADYDFGTSVDLSDTILYLWFAFSKVPHATNYMRIIVTDVNGNWGEWNLFNKGNLPHLSWVCWTVKTTVSFDATSTTPPDKTQIRKVGWRMDSVAAKTYIYWDAWRYGEGLLIKGGDSFSPATFEDLYLEDSNQDNAYGIIDKYNGVYYVQGKIYIGSTVDGEDTYFKDTNQIIVFKLSKGSPTDMHGIIGQGNSSGITKIFFGEKIGDSGLSGIFITAPSQMGWKLDMSDTNITEFGFYGCTFQNANVIKGQAYASGKEFLGTNFVSCGEMEPDTGVVKRCNFISAPGRAIKISSTSHRVTECNFIGNYVAIRHDAGGNYLYDALMFYGNTYDVENTSSDEVVIDRINGSNPSTKLENPGSITINPISVLVKVTVLDIVTKQPVPNARVLIEAASGGPLPEGTDILLGLTNEDGIVQTSFQYLDNQPIRGRVRRATPSYGVIYKPAEISGTITSTGFQTTVLLIRDE